MNENALTGFDAATDQLYMDATPFRFSSQAFLANEVTQPGANTIITNPNNHANEITRIGLSPSSLSQAKIHFVQSAV